MKFKLGEKVKETVTGYTGIVTAYSEFLNGCKRYCIEAKAAKNDIKEYWFDEQRLVSLEKPKKIKRSNTGGPRPNPTRQSTPKL